MPTIYIRKMSVGSVLTRYKSSILLRLCVLPMEVRQNSRRFDFVDQRQTSENVGLSIFFWQHPPPCARLNYSWHIKQPLKVIGIRSSPIWTIHAGQTSSCLSTAAAFSTKMTNRSSEPASAPRRDAPPVFFLVAHDDKSNPIEAAMLCLEYKKRDLFAELHICAKGGHGFGMRKDGKPINDWPQRCAEWMKSLGYLDAK